MDTRTRDITDTPSSDDSHSKEKTSPPSLLNDLPEDIKQLELYPRSPLRVLCLLAQTSQQYEKETVLRLLPRLLESTVNAEPESYEQKDETKLAAIAILKRHPELLFETSQVTDHFNRKFQASPYRLFLGAGDVWARKQIHEEIIAKIEDQEARAQAYAQTKVEFYKQFPDYKGPWPLELNTPEEALYDQRNKDQIEQVKAQLKIIVEKITADPCTNGEATKAETTKAVSDLCKIFAPTEGEIIKTGLHFPLGILKEIGKEYDAQFTPWTSAQLAYFSREVIGGAEAALTAVDGQCVKGGLSNLNMEKGPDRTDGLFCRRPKGIPESKAPLVGKLGRTMFVDPYDGESCFATSTPGRFDWYNKSGWGCVAWRVGRGLARVLLASFGQLMENKSRSYGSYYAVTERVVNIPSR